MMAWNFSIIYLKMTRNRIYKNTFLLDSFYSICINVYLGVNDHAWYVVATIDIQAYLIANRAVGRSKNPGGK